MESKSIDFMTIIEGNIIGKGQFGTVKESYDLKRQ